MTNDQKQWGSGRWQSIHVTAAWADTPDKFKFFCGWIRNQVENLPCEFCIKHAKAYLDANPPEKAIDAFIWSWEFHNTVNRRLNKSEMEYSTAKQIYLYGNIKLCNQNCNNPDKIENTFSFIS